MFLNRNLFNFADISANGIIPLDLVTPKNYTLKLSAISSSRLVLSVLMLVAFWLLLNLDAFNNCWSYSRRNSACLFPFGKQIISIYWLFMNFSIKPRYDDSGPSIIPPPITQIPNETVSEFTQIWFFNLFFLLFYRRLKCRFLLGKISKTFLKLKR